MILVTGASGFLGKYVCAELTRQGLDYHPHSREEDGNLLDYETIRLRYNTNRPHTIIHLAARVGGIGANQAQSYNFMSGNLQMGLNIVDLALMWKSRVIMVSTVCAYPAVPSIIPFVEDSLWEGFPELSNAGYGLAKRTLTQLLWEAQKQYNLKSITLNLANLYGVGDSLDLETSHVIPAVFGKIAKAKRYGEKLVLWGDGSPTRDFLHVRDAASAVVAASIPRYGLDMGPKNGINIGSGLETSIKEMAYMACDLMEFPEQDVEWDNSYPNGQIRRVLNIERAKALIGFTPSVKLEDGMREIAEFYKRN